MEFLGTRKLFPINQKCQMTAAFLDNQKSSIWSSLVIFLPLFSRAWCANKLHNGLTKKLSGFKHFYYKKAAVILDFCLFGNIRHNFLVPRIIESAPKTFMPIQTPDLYRVTWTIFDKKSNSIQNSTLVHLRRRGGQNWLRFGPFGCWMTPKVINIRDLVRNL